MDIKKFKAERQWIRNQLANVSDFWLKNGWQGYPAPDRRAACASG